MNPLTYIHTFAGIAIVALCLQIFSSFWLQLGIGLLVSVLLAFLLRK